MRLQDMHVAAKSFCAKPVPASVIHGTVVSTYPGQAGHSTIAISSAVVTNEAVKGKPVRDSHVETRSCEGYLGENDLGSIVSATSLRGKVDTARRFWATRKQSS